MPHQRGHRHLSRRIPIALLRRQEPAVARPFFRQDRPLGATGLSRSAQRKFPEPCAWIWSLASASIFPRPSEGAKLAAVRRPHLSKLGANSESLGAVGVQLSRIDYDSWQPGHFVGRYVYQLLSSGDRPGGAGGSGRGWISGEGSAVAPVLWPAALRFRNARPGKEISHPSHAVPGSRNRRGHACRGTGAELRLRLSRRIARPLSKRSARCAITRTDFSLERIFALPCRRL